MLSAVSAAIWTPRRSLPLVDMSSDASSVPRANVDAAVHCDNTELLSMRDYKLKEGTFQAA